MNTNIDLFDKQIQAMQILQDPEWQGELVYGGGARGGKSYLSCHWLVSSSFIFPGSQWLLGFEELKHLRRTTLPDLLKVIKLYSYDLNGSNWQSVFRLNQMDMVIEFINGSKIFLAELSNMPSDPDFDRLGSLSLTGFAVDEAQRVRKKALDTLQARLSLTQGDGWQTKPKALYTCNPSKTWIYFDFWKPLVKEGKKIQGKLFITSLYTDNPNIDHESYRTQLINTGNKVQIERLLHGNFEYDDDDAKLMSLDNIASIFSNYVEEGLKCIIVDVARFGRDRANIYVFNGWKITSVESIAKSDRVYLVERIEHHRERHKIMKKNIVVDEGGVGGGVVDMGGYIGFISNARPIGNKNENDPTQKKQGANYFNLRSQCYFYLADRVNKGEVSVYENVDPDIKQRIVEDLDTVKQVKIGNDGPLQIISKDKQKEVLGRSPDDGDVLMMRSFLDLMKPVSLNLEETFILS